MRMESDHCLYTSMRLPLSCALYRMAVTCATILGVLIVIHCALIAVLGRALSASPFVSPPYVAQYFFAPGRTPRRAFDRLTSASLNQPSSQAAVRNVNVLSVDFHPLPEVEPVIINILSKTSLSLVRRTSSCRFCRPYSRYLVSLVQVRHICQEFSDLFQEASRSHFCRRSNYRIYRDISVS